MEGEDRGEVADFEEWEEKGADMPEVDVEEVALESMEGLKNFARFGWIDLDGLVEDMAINEATEFTRTGSREGGQGRRGELGEVFDFLSQDMLIGMRKRM